MKYYKRSKLTAVCLHIISLAVFVAGISLLYCNENFNKGIGWMNSETYEDSPAFMEQFEHDTELIFDYVRYRDIFEKNEVFDQKSEIFSINIGPGKDEVYTVEDVVEYAKSEGFFINEQYQVEKSGTGKLAERESDIPDTSYLVNWRRYVNPDNEEITEPGDAYMTVDSLVDESLTAIGRYYLGYKRLSLNPSNIKYSLIYDRTYSNDTALSEKTAPSYGAYAICRSGELLIENNLPRVPDNLAMLAENNKEFFGENYKVIIAVNTGYPETDEYYAGERKYGSDRDLYFYGLIAVTLGGFVMIITAVWLAFMSGRTDADPKARILYPVDRIGFEASLGLCATAIIIATFFNEKIGSNILHVYVSKENWSFADSMLQYVLVYSCLFITAFSVIRAFKAGIIWQKSGIRKLIGSLEVYRTKRSFTKRLGTNFIIYCMVNIFIASLIAVLCMIETTLVHRFVIIALMFILAVFDLMIFHRLYRNAAQTDKIAEAIDSIAGGDTGYQLELSQFSGKEALLAGSINNIGRGLESAISEQVKSERLKADLITNVSHDIKTPLTSIINYVDLIKREKPENEKIREYISVLEQKAMHLKNLTEDLVEASKASSGNMQVEMHDIDFVELVQQTNGEFEEKYAQRELSIISNMPKEPAIIYADGRHLWRVLENIYNNAYKYASKGSRVYVDIEKTEDKAVFTIKNVSENPLNFSPKELTERFVRGDVSRATEGSGLGLSIAQSLTRLQNGGFEIQIDGDLFKVLLSFELKKEAGKPKDMQKDMPEGSEETLI